MIKKLNFMIYDLEHFIRKIENTPEELIITNAFYNGIGGYCINGMCGVKPDNHVCELIITDESLALKELFSCLQVHIKYDDYAYVIKDLPNYSLKAAYINNGSTVEYQQPTAKQRILAALNDIRVHQILTAALEVQEEAIEIVDK